MQGDVRTEKPLKLQNPSHGMGPSGGNPVHGVTPLGLWGSKMSKLS